MNPNNSVPIYVKNIVIVNIINPTFDGWLQIKGNLTKLFLCVKVKLYGRVLAFWRVNILREPVHGCLRVVYQCALADSDGSAVTSYRRLG